MNIAFVEIQNFRKLKSCRVEIAPKETILVGANNSGKTSAMDSMILFLKRNRRKDISTTDFTLSNWSHINHIGKQWTDSKDENSADLTLEQWLPYLPSIDIWLDVNDADIHHVIHLLPTLDWNPDQNIGVRLVFAPKDVKKLYKAFREVSQSARDTESTKSSNNDKRKLSLWPETMRDFLDKELRNHFEVKAYILDPANYTALTSGTVHPQALPANSDPMDKEPFDGLFKIDVISAQRGFSDPKTEDDSHSSFASLSTQLRQYFTKHLNPSESPDASDFDALLAIEEAKSVFDDKLKISFKPAISELEGLNYPGFSDPQISLTSKINAVDTLDHKTAVQFHVTPQDDDGTVLSLPEQYNGLGYQNLISMVFSLIRFRDEWMRVGKAAKRQGGEDTVIEPLHLVLIEEPEAHLHAQVQQVFIKKAYKVLREHPNLKDKQQLNTQMIVSTHSSHVAHELDFTCLRYFRREQATKGGIPSATVVNLSQVFGDENETSKFATRYIKSAHCDLFFADAAILVEGSAERMLVPHFIRHHFKNLDQSYISLLEIGGSHAHRLRPLLETLGLLSLIITDLDSIEQTGTKKAFPERGKSYRTGNTTLKEWLPKMEPLDEVLNCPEGKKQSTNEQVRVAYQCPIKPGGKFAEQESIPYTFEDSLALANMELFRKYKNPIGLLKKLTDALGKDTLNEINKAMYESVTGEHSNKAKMALDLLYLTEPKNLTTPKYISDGLKWLKKKLAEKKQEFASASTTEVDND